VPDVTFSFTDAQLDRLKAAIGDAINSDRSPASNAQAKQWQINRWKAFVRQYERRLQESAIVLGQDINVT